MFKMHINNDKRFQRYTWIGLHIPVALSQSRKFSLSITQSLKWKWLSIPKLEMNFNQFIELFLSTADPTILPRATETGTTLQHVLSTSHVTHSEKCEDSAEQKSLLWTVLFQSSGWRPDSHSKTGDLELVKLVISYTQLACLTTQFISTVKLVQVQAVFWRKSPVFFSVHVTQIKELPVAPTRFLWESQ